MTPLRKVEMALAWAGPSTGDGGHGGVDERERVFAAQRFDGRASRPAADRRRGAVAQAEAPAGFPIVEGPPKGWSRQSGVETPRSDEQQQAARRRPRADHGDRKRALRRLRPDAGGREAWRDARLPGFP